MIAAVNGSLNKNSNFKAYFYNPKGSYIPLDPEAHREFNNAASL